MGANGDTLDRELEWLREFTPATQRAAASLPPLRGERVLVVCHLDAKMVPYFDALAGAGAEVWACAANPATTRDAVTVHLEDTGVHVPARKDDQPWRHAANLRAAICAGPTLLSEMGADATAATGGKLESVRGGLEATGTGVDRLRELALAYPVFNWDEVPIKQGLHNRHLVGLVAANTFLNVTGLSLYGKTVLVVGYGPVGRGVADAARSFGAAVEVCDVDPAARLAAAHLGFPTVTLEAGLPRADVVFTATGRDGALSLDASPPARAARSSRTSATRAASCPSRICGGASWTIPGPTSSAARSTARPFTCSPGAPCSTLPPDRATPTTPSTS